MPEMEGGGSWDSFDDGTLPHHYSPPPKEECVQLELDDFNNYNPLNNYKKLYQDAWRNEKVIRAEWLREGEEIPVSLMDEALIRELVAQEYKQTSQQIAQHLAQVSTSSRLIPQHLVEQRIKQNIERRKPKGIISRIFGR